MIKILQGDCLAKLRELPDACAQTCVTSPPYWGLRDYGCECQIGLEKTPDEYVEKLVRVFKEVNRVLRDDGTLWLNLGDSYNAGRDGGHAGGKNGCSRPEIAPQRSGANAPGLKPKDLVGIPWMVAFALRADGWYLRSDIIWHKPNPMPESVTDRPTKAHEYIFLLSKSQRYFYDAEAIKEQSENAGSIISLGEKSFSKGQANGAGVLASGNGKSDSYTCPTTRNKRSVWTVPTQCYSEAHFATFPEDLIKPCIMAGTSAKGCCPKCGAPWEREVNRAPSTSKECPKTNEAHAARGGTGIPVGTVGKSGSGRINGYSETLGWKPTCECGETATIPCTVIDTFGGSGTTGLVATELGRKSILIELNPKYVQLIEQRTNVTPGLQLS